MGQDDPKYDGEGKTEFLNNYFSDIILQNATKPVCLTTYDLKARKFAILRSTEADPSGKQILVADACNASSAAPAYFPCFKVNGRWLIDGGIVVNNPTMIAYAEAKKNWESDDIYVVSVGTGSRTRPIDGEEAADWGGMQWIANGLLDVAMDESTVDFLAATILRDKYIRVTSDL